MEKTTLGKSIFWWTLFCLFWLTSAIVIGYAFGYRFSIERGVFVFGGSITIKSTPLDADIYINKKLYSSKKLNRINNSYHIDGLMPGIYDIEVTSDSYASWHKRITVNSGKSSEFWNVILTKNDYTQTSYDTSNVLRLFISPRKNITAVAEQNGNIFSVRLVTAQDNKSEEIYSSERYLFTDNQEENIEWTPDADKIIVPIIKKDSNKKDYLIEDVATKGISLLSQVTQKENISVVRWDPKNKNALYFISDHNLFRLDLTDITNSKEIAQNIASYEIASGGLYFLQLPEGMIYKTNFNGTNNPVQITRSAPDDMSDPYYKIIAYDDDRILFLNKKGNLYIYNRGDLRDYFEKLSGNALGSQFSDDGKKLLFWNNHEITVYFVRKWEVQPTRKEGDITPITKYSEKIGNVQWSRDYEHVLFTANKKLKLIELDQRDNRNLMDLISLASSDAIVVNNNADALIYFTDSDPEKGMVMRTIEFPERTGLLQGIIPGAGNQFQQNKPGN